MEEKIVLSMNVLSISCDVLRAINQSNILEHKTQPNYDKVIRFQIFEYVLK